MNFDNLFRYHYRPLCLYAIHYIHDVDAAEDRERFDEILEKCHIDRPRGSTVFTAEEAKEVATYTLSKTGGQGAIQEGLHILKKLNLI